MQQAGRVDDARWDWDLAANFLPEVATFDLRRFGDAGRALTAYGTESTRTERPPEGDSIEGPAESLPGLTPPRVVRRVKPEYPKGARQSGAQGAVVVEVIIDESGTVLHPRVVEKGGHPGLTYAAVQALREWEIEPATQEGRPVKAYLELRVHFRLQQDESPPRFRPIRSDSGRR